MIEPLIIKTKKQLFSTQAGIFSSPAGGEGFDFLEMREYAYGEDARRIDWIVSAKAGKPYVRLYQEERSRTLALVPLLCDTLHFGSTTTATTSCFCARSPTSTGSRKSPKSTTSDGSRKA